MVGKRFVFLDNTFIFTDNGLHLSVRIWAPDVRIRDIIQTKIATSIFYIYLYIKTLFKKASFLMLFQIIPLGMLTLILT